MDSNGHAVDISDELVKRDSWVAGKKVDVACFNLSNAPIISFTGIISPTSSYDSPINYVMECTVSWNG